MFGTLVLSFLVFSIHESIADFSVCCGRVGNGTVFMQSDQGGWGTVTLQPPARESFAPTTSVPWVPYRMKIDQNYTELNQTK